MRRGWSLQMKMLLSNFIRRYRLRRAYRLICHLNRKKFVQSEFDKFVREMTPIYEENPSFFRS